MDEIEKLLEPVLTFVETYLFWFVIAAAGLFLLMLIFFIAMARNSAKCRKLKKNSGNSAALAKENERLTEENESTKQRIQSLKEAIGALEQNDAVLEKENASLQDEVARLKRELDHANTRADSANARADSANARAQKQSARRTSDSEIYLDDVIDPDIFEEEDSDEQVVVRRSPAKSSSGSAAKSGTKRASTATTKDKDKDADSYMVAYDRQKGDWVVRKKNAERATRRAATKEEAVKIARDLAKKNDANLSIRKKDGKFQKQH